MYRTVVRIAIAALVVAALLVGTGIWAGVIRFGRPPSFEEQACGIPNAWLQRTRNGYFAPRAGQVALIPHTPAYMASGAGGWSHSGPWPYLQDVPLVFYGPGIVPATGEVERPVSLDQIAPTTARLMKGSLGVDAGEALEEVASIDEALVAGERPRLIVTVVWDGGGWNALRQWPDAWPTLARLMEEGISYTNATVGSSPSVTPSVHTTIGTGVFPDVHGITNVPMRDESGEVVDAFLDGESSRFIQTQTVGERWDTQQEGRALIGMLGYEPWHLGMIGQGAERAGGDKDDAVWLNTETNEWISNEDYYRLPPAIPATPGLDEDLRALDARDGAIDETWRGHPILDQQDRIEETPAFIDYHARALLNLVREDGYGADDTTDLLYTNFKQIDRLGHYFNMAAEEVHDAIIESDKALGEIVDGLNDEVGEGKWVLVVTADHGQQPDAAAIDGYGISPNEVRDDINARFGDGVAVAVWPTEVFMDEDALKGAGATVEDVAAYLSDYRLADQLHGFSAGWFGRGTIEARDRLFDLAVPAERLPDFSC